MAYKTLSDHTQLYNLGEKLYLAGKKLLCILDLDFYTSPRQQLGIVSLAWEVSDTSQCEHYSEAVMHSW